MLPPALAQTKLSLSGATACHVLQAVSRDCCPSTVRTRLVKQLSQFRCLGVYFRIVCSPRDLVIKSCLFQLTILLRYQPPCYADHDDCEGYKSNGRREAGLVRWSVLGLVDQWPDDAVHLCAGLWFRQRSSSPLCRRRTYVRDANGQTCRGRAASSADSFRPNHWIDANAACKCNRDEDILHNWYLDRDEDDIAHQGCGFHCVECQSIVPMYLAGCTHDRWQQSSL